MITKQNYNVNVFTLKFIEGTLT